MLRTLSVALAVGGALGTSFAQAQVADRPNILVIWGDDIGWQNVSAYGMGSV